MLNKLYLISTPIGNLREVSFRALEIIKSMDYIACEDTRIGGKLLFSYKIKKKFISCHKYNEIKASEKIITLLKNNKKVAYICDAGTPCISDPGQILVKKCIKNNIDVVPISGSSALLNIVVASGFDVKHFYFHGFLSRTVNKRLQELRELSDKKEALIFYESPHRLKNTLKNMLEIFGNRNICIGREMTKLHEEFIRGALSDVLDKINSKILRGEFSIIIEGQKNKLIVSNVTDNIDQIIDKIKFFKNSLTTKDAIKKTSLLYKIPKNKIYSLYHNHIKNK
ncbi:MAG: 16S rRNA (cytidine(1402)-2'-O)-methyltransferase [Bacilli bacterium]|nr:16S rRNA (cytidine(1402)-2'-O)-methyltransferase [Bacilli bacterium]